MEEFRLEETDESVNIDDIAGEDLPEDDADLDDDTDDDLDESEEDADDVDD